MHVTRKTKTTVSKRLTLNDLPTGSLFTFKNRDNVYIKSMRSNGVLRRSRLMNQLEDQGQELCVLLASGRIYSVEGDAEVVLINDYDFVVHQ